MLHVRVVSPRDLTGRLLAALTASAGVHNLVVLRGAAQRPEGDAVQFDVLNRSANPVLRELRSLDLDNRGSITVAQVNVAIAGLIGAVGIMTNSQILVIGAMVVGPEYFTTIPAAASVGLSVAFANWHDAAGSLLQLVLNVVLLIVVGAAGLSLQRVIWRRVAGQQASEAGAVTRSRLG